MDGQAYASLLKNLYERTASGIKLDLSVMSSLLDALGRPDKAHPHVVVAGTNGKGSVSCMLACALQQAGYRVGLYTSPHLLCLTERIQINGEEVTREEIAWAYEQVLQASHTCQRPPTFFECITAVACVLFKHHAVDVVVMEVGLGGRLDATNAVDKALSVITSIGLDHQEFLGDTIASIAYEKAGIISWGGDVVCAPQTYSDALKVCVEEAARQNARITCVPSQEKHASSYALLNQDVVRVACGVLREKEWRVQQEHVEWACAHARWPGRYQTLQHEGVDVVIDGAHNEDGMRVLMQRLTADPQYAKRPVHAVFSMVRGKNLTTVASILGPHVVSLHTCVIGSSRTYNMHELSSLLPQAEVFSDGAGAYQKAHALAKKDKGIVLICGSLFLVGDMLSYLFSKPKDPPVDA